MSFRDSPSQYPQVSARSFACALVLVSLPATVGCAGRAAPFSDLDKAQVTILRLQGQQAQAQPQPGGFPAIPGLPPELQALGQQALQPLLQYIPPGLIPGLPPPGAVPGAQPSARLYRNQWVIVAEQPLMDENLKEELLDLFGDESSFNEQRGNCFFPGMAVSFMSPTRPEPVDVVISLSCNQAVGYGFQWPHPQSGFAPETHQALTDIYTRLFGTPPPPQA